MAHFPQGLSQIDARCNAGERRVLHQLKRCLGDDYLVWHDVPIGPQARQPDFVVLSPRWGVLLLEVKDWRRSSMLAATRDRVELATPRGHVVVPHPLRQARDVMLELVDLMKRDPALVHAEGLFAGKLLFPYGWGVVMSALKRDELAGSDFHEVFPETFTLLRDDLDPGIEPMAFQHRLWGLFTVSYPHTLTLPQRDRVRWHLFPEVRLNTQAELPLAGPPAAQPALQLPDLMTVMDLQQEQVARTLGEGHRVIHGAAGSGKTMILVYRARWLAQAARAGRPILVLCFNRALAGRIDAMLRERGVDERVVVRTFHGWCQDLVRSYQLDVPAGAGADEYYEALAATVERAVDTGFVPGGQYMALLVDEAHDFEDAWLKIAARMVAPETNSLLVLYDDAQSIYQARRRRRFSFASVGIDARGRTHVLRMNYRNTAEVLALAMHCAAGLLGEGGSSDDGSSGEDGLRTVPPTSAGRRGPLPVLLQAQHAGEEAAWVAERVEAHLRGGGTAQEVAIVARTRALLRPFAAALRERGVPLQSMGRQAFRHFDWREPSAKLLTMHSAKGLEFPLVFVVGLHCLPFADESVVEATRLLYVAMTRATQQLVLSSHGDSVVVQLVRRSLVEVGQRFAGV
jgi:hypothetical protein